MRAADVFQPADILLPSSGFETWSVIACDQFTSQQEYWEEADRLVGDADSTLRLILPEVFLHDDPDARTAAINAAMREYIDRGVLKTYRDALIYVERTQPDGRLRRGIVGAVDLDAYSFEKGAKTPIRATEGTVLDRLPPRVRIRKDAPLELPHVMLLFDDPLDSVMAPLTAAKDTMERLYDFDLMLGGGHLCGYLIPASLYGGIYAAFDALCVGEDPLLFAVGDGNHSLATAKKCAADYPTEHNRRALVEVVNLHENALDFEPIYRLILHADGLVEALEAAATADGHEVRVLTEKGEKTLHFPPTHALPVGTVDDLLSAYLAAHPEAAIDYIHGEEALAVLSKQPGAVGLLFKGMHKSELFPAVEQSGSLPRKTFSMGHAEDKRYYTEARRIR